MLTGAIGTGLTIDEGGEPAGADAVRRLDQRDLRAEVGEQAAGERGALIGQVEDADPGEGQRLRLAHRASIPMVAASEGSVPSEG